MTAKSNRREAIREAITEAFGNTQQMECRFFRIFCYYSHNFFFTTPSYIGHDLICNFCSLNHAKIITDYTIIIFDTIIII